MGKGSLQYVFHQPPLPWDVLQGLSCMLVSRRTWNLTGFFTDESVSAWSLPFLQGAIVLGHL